MRPPARYSKCHLPSCATRQSWVNPSYWRIEKAEESEPELAEAEGPPPRRVSGSRPWWEKLTRPHKRPQAAKSASPVSASDQS
jgi:hypothetical protein